MRPTPSILPRLTSQVLRASYSTAPPPPPPAPSSTLAHPTASSPSPSHPSPTNPPNTTPPTDSAPTKEQQHAQARKKTFEPVPLSPSLGPPKEHGPLKTKLVWGIARLFGYNSDTSTAIRVTSEYYDRAAEWEELNAAWVREANLPPTFQTWFQLTNLHVWLLTVRFRSLPPPLGKLYTQELINHFFIDLESRMRHRFGVTQDRTVKTYMRAFLEMWRGAGVAYDEGLVRGDAILAAAIWRNVYSGRGVKEEVDSGDMEASPSGRVVREEGGREGEGWEVGLPVEVERIVRYLRREVKRLEELSDEEIKRAGVAVGRNSVTAFGQVE